MKIKRIGNFTFISIFITKFLYKYKLHAIIVCNYMFIKESMQRIIKK